MASQVDDEQTLVLGLLFRSAVRVDKLLRFEEPKVAIKKEQKRDMQKISSLMQKHMTDLKFDKLKNILRLFSPALVFVDADNKITQDTKYDPQRKEYSEARLFARTALAIHFKLQDVIQSAEQYRRSLMITQNKLRELELGDVQKVDEREFLVTKLAKLEVATSDTLVYLEHEKLASAIVEFEREHPLYFAMQSHLNDTKGVQKTLQNVKVKRGKRQRVNCALCGEKAENTCEACATVHYCSRECQGKHWAEHKAECSKSSEQE